jgi:hypothetical protein
MDISTKNRPSGRFFVSALLLLSLFVHGRSPAPIAELLELDLAGHELFVL